jgi:hypothetical protein
VHGNLRPGVHVHRRSSVLLHSATKLVPRRHVLML